MKRKHRIVRIVLFALLTAAAIAALIYNLSLHRVILYCSSAIAVCGEAALLVREIICLKKDI